MTHIARLVFLSACGFGSAFIGGLVSCYDPGAPSAACDDCADNGGFLYGCYGGALASSSNYKGTVCVSSAQNNSVDITNQCQTTWGGPFWWVNFYEPVPCDGIGGGVTEGEAQSSCDDWDPDGEITPTANGWEITQDLVDYIVEDPLRLANCDTATVEYDAVNSVFKIQNAASGTLLYELGFRNNDVITSVNGYSLSDLDDVGDAIGDLYFRTGETEYTFVVNRSGTPISRYIEIVP